MFGENNDMEQVSQYICDIAHSNHPCLGYWVLYVGVSQNCKGPPHSLQTIGNMLQKYNIFRHQPPKFGMQVKQGT